MWSTVTRDGRRGRHFDVSASFAVKAVARWRDTGSMAAVQRGRPKGTGKLAPYRAFLIGRLETRPDITMPELATELEAVHQVKADPAELSRFLCRAGFTYKKTLMASERERAEVINARRLWILSRQARMRLELHRLVFLDETGVTTKMTRLRGRSLRGQRPYASAPFAQRGTQTFVAGLRCWGMRAVDHRCPDEPRHFRWLH